MSGHRIAGIDVSRETLDRLKAYAAVLEKWNRRINLIAPGSVAQIWDRHIVDSAQVFAHAPRDARHWVDLGSGGGLPGLVCAILAAEHMPGCRFTLIESDQRKTAFLLTAGQTLELTLHLLPERAETCAPQNADIVTARALAPLVKLLPLVARHLAPGAVAILPKGKSWSEELAAARLQWQFAQTIHSSQTDPAARLLVLKDIAHA